jgi:23S rRNA pseudouridine1911/1915/1917 synthase
MRYYQPDIIYEDHQVIAVEKPAGLLTIASAQEKEATLYHYVHDYLVRRWGRDERVFIVHRLDQDTSGVIVFAKDFQVKEDLQELFAEGQPVRRYQALLSKMPEEKEGRIVIYLEEDRMGNVFLADHPSRYAEKAITDYKIVGIQRGHPCAEILIHTGKRNQIRLSFLSLGCPILGDKKYGGPKASRLFLHASELDLRCYKDLPCFDFRSEVSLFEECKPI